MSGLIVPDSARAPKDPAKDAYEALTDAQKAELDALAERDDPEDNYVEVETAFVVVKTLDGQYMIIDDLKPEIKAQHSAAEPDILAAFKMIEMNMLAQMTAGITQQAMMQQAMQLQAHQRDQALMKGLKL